MPADGACISDRSHIIPAFEFADLLPFIAIGFAAQLVDGALGMAFGVINSTLLMSVVGLSPAAASASVHVVETFTTAASGISHTIHRNVDWRLFGRLAVPGVIGGVLGAYVLSNIDAAVARPFVMAYLCAVGIYLLYRAWRGAAQRKEPKHIAPLGLVGGFLDAAGGGGWGPVVTSNLLAQGTNPRKTIGTVNTAEFFLSTTISVAFLTALGWEAFTFQVIGLLIGGLVAAPFGAILVKRLPPRGLLTMVGVLVVLTSAWSIYSALSA